MMGCGLMLRGSGLWEVERRGRSQKGPEAEPISSETGRWRRWATEGRASFGSTEREREDFFNHTIRHKTTHSESKL